MTLYVERPPNPTAGVDWSYMVPGRYLERITGITATLTTVALPSTVALDASGNGHDGTYGGPGPGVLFGMYVGNGLGSTGPISLVGNWSVEGWYQSVSSVPGLWDLMFIENTFATPDANVSINPANGSVQIEWNKVAGAGNRWFAFCAAGTVPIDANPHYWVLTVVGNVPTFYLDGVAKATAVLVAGTAELAANWNLWVPGPFGGGPHGPPMFVPGIVAGDDAIESSISGGSTSVLDEYAWYSHGLTAGQVAAHYAAGLVGIGAYTAAVLADAPFGYWHLDDVASGTGRTPGLFVTDGTDQVALIPDGFSAQTTPGPYFYSWLPTLAADTRDPTGTITTVAIPKLILPAGYSVGTRTPDIQPGDQWSDIAVWWNDDAQRSQAAVDAFLYPPGALLVYQRIGT